MAKISKGVPLNQQITRRVDKFVLDLLEHAEKQQDNLPLEERIALLTAFGKWVAIKNKLMDVMEGEQLNDIRKRLHDPDASPFSGHTFTREERARGARNAVNKRLGRKYATAGDGAQLADLQARLPRRGDRRPDRNSDAGSGEGNPAPDR
jgi:hypothetical protein